MGKSLVGPEKIQAESRKPSERVDPTSATEFYCSLNQELVVGCELGRVAASRGIVPVYSLVGGIQVEYGIGAGQPIVKLKSGRGISHRAVYTGTGVLLFHWVQEGKTQAWRCDSSMLDPQIIEPEEETDGDGSQTLTFTLQESMPAAGLLRRRWEGMFLAPAIHIECPNGTGHLDFSHQIAMVPV